MSKPKNTQYFQHKEIFSRMNFLYQAATLMVGRNNNLAAYYGQLCRSIAQKGVVKMEPDMKRNLCKNCATPQQVGVSAELSVEPPARRRKRKRKSTTECLDDGAEVQVLCQICLHKRSFRVDSNYQCWVDDPASIVETIRGNERISHEPLNAINSISKTENQPKNPPKKHLNQKPSQDKSFETSNGALQHNSNHEMSIEIG